MKRMRFGFSLMELLVVIALIGILTAVVSVSFTSIQKKTRDSRRKSDMKAVQNAFEQYYAANNRYPIGTCEVDLNYLPAGMPSDPKFSDPDDNYSAICAEDGTAFAVCAKVEAESGNSLNRTGEPGTGYYCLTQLQDGGSVLPVPTSPPLATPTSIPVSTSTPVPTAIPTSAPSHCWSAYGSCNANCLYKTPAPACGGLICVTGACSGDGTGTCYTTYATTYEGFYDSQYIVYCTDQGNGPSTISCQAEGTQCTWLP